MISGFYDIQYTYSLSAHQRRLLAIGITKLHNTAFISSEISVHVKFTCSAISPLIHSADYFVGGKELRACNRIVAYLQSGGFRDLEQGTKADKEMSRKLAEGIKILWDSYVCSGKSKGLMDAKLNAIMVVPAAVNGWGNYEWWEEESGSESSYLAIGFEVRTHDFWRCNELSDASSDSNSEQNLRIWNNRKYKNNDTAAQYETRLRNSINETPKTKARLSRKAKFCGLK